MKPRIKHYIILACLLVFIFHITPSYAQPEQVSQPVDELSVLIEANAWGRAGLLVLYYPSSETLCFINGTSRACLDIEEFSPAYKKLVRDKVQASKN